METQKQLIYSQISAIITEIEAVHKKKNPDSNVRYAYRRIDDFMNALNPLLGKHQVTIVPEVLDNHRESITTSNGGKMNSVIMKIAYHFYAADGSCIKAVMIGEAFDSGDKASNKAQSVALKYAIAQVFMVPTEDQLDPDDVDPLKQVKPTQSASKPLNEIDYQYTDSAQQNAREVKNAKTVTEAQLKRLFALQQKSKLNQQEVQALIKMRWNKTSSKELSMSEYDELISVIQANTEA